MFKWDLAQTLDPGLCLKVTESVLSRVITHEFKLEHDSQFVEFDEHEEVFLRNKIKQLMKDHANGTYLKEGAEAKYEDNISGVVKKYYKVKKDDENCCLSFVTFFRKPKKKLIINNESLKKLEKFKARKDGVPRTPHDEVSILIKDAIEKTNKDIENSQRSLISKVTSNCTIV